ncbi:Peptidoglycan hydrolase, glycoside hydrolase family 73 protein [Thermobacillus xylanilyticus]|jgi:flagellar protein FlgJ|uniref:Peptidoglycan hydrolase, glycoside hydrolase family 73 protein n=1 Tax=Thermobacillus xylanilyticus TaxID=76633 RepID=A0ABM8V7W7_THEXY|nr:glucosaminidase domain-containing protein [Thermobacillus xylanilyticus]CAG5091897.1 Peptidoglycan hydrolase, glycoside hydrolase family 73 protein [Thermobacillus xylanilyticus]
MSAAAFIAQIAPIAVQLRIEGSPIFPSVRIAQSGLETGWKIPPWNNLGGYKVGSGKLTPYWRGKIVTKGTWEVYDGKRVDATAAFRAYDSVEDFFRDQDLLFENKRYTGVRTAQSPEEQADMLQACGYATDPQYAQKLRNIIAAHNLKRYDTEAEVQKQMIGELKKQIEQLTAEQAQLRQRLETLESRARVDVPAWAREAVDAAVKAGIVDTPEGGSLDFYRMLTVMHRTGHIGNN